MIPLVLALALQGDVVLEDTPPRFTEYAAADTPCVAVDGANLRAAPEKSAPVVASLALGARVAVIAPHGDAVAVGDRRDRFYEVTAGGKRGFVFGNVLTPQCADVDVDGDGHPDRVTLAWTSTYLARVRAIDAHGAPSSVDVPLPPGPGRGGRASWFAVPPLKRDRPALGVLVCRGDACTASIVVGEPGMLGVLLTTSIKSGAVPSVVADGSRVTLGTARAELGPWPLVVCPHCGPPPSPWSPVPPVRLFGIPSPDPYYAAAPDYAGKCEANGVVDDGVHTGARVITCLAPSPHCKGIDCPGPQTSTYLEVKPWELIPLHVADGEAGSSIATALDKHGATFRAGDGTKLAGIGGSPVVLERNGGALAVVDGEPHVDAAAPVLFVHRDLGRVHGDLAKPSAFYVESSGRVLRLEPSVTAPAGYTAVVDRGCGAEEPLMLAGALANNALSSSTQQSVESLYTGTAGAVRERDAAALHAILAHAPLLVLRDPFDRAVVGVPVDVKRECLAEPMIYLTSDHPIDARVSLGAPFDIAVAEPAQAEGAWRVHVDGAHDPIFYEGVSARHWPSTPVAEVPSVDAPAILDDIAAHAGLSERARVELVRAWSSRAARAPWVRIGIVAVADLDRLAPLAIEPRPDAVARVAIVVELLDRPSSSRPPEPPLSRALSMTGSPGSVPAGSGSVATEPMSLGGGFVVQEWGGILVDARAQ